MDEIPEKEQLLRGYEPTMFRSRSLVSGSWQALVACIAIVSLASNGFLIYQYNNAMHSLGSYPSRYAELTSETSLTYNVSSKYNSDNLTYSDQQWESIDASPVVVALTDQYALEHDVPISEARFPWDESKGIYHIKAFHHLHCLKNLHRAFTDHQLNIPTLVSTSHIHHCLDTLRQDLMCYADDTPMPTAFRHHYIGHGQIRQCRSMDALRSWTEQPEHHSCFRMLSDYRSVPNALEEFAYCKEDSPYLEVMRNYFAEFGHRDPYGN